MQDNTNSLFREVKKGTTDKQIIFFPYLGGSGSAFNNLTNELELDANIWVANPPGHGNSKRELVEDIDVLVEMYYGEIKKIMKPECVLFGHSMGGVIAYYLAHRMMESEEIGGNLKTLILSACATPCSMKNEKNSALPDDELLEKLVSYGAMPEEIIQEKSLLKLFIPVFRGDYKILESAAVKEPIPIDIKTFLIWGENDFVQPADSLGQWLPYLKNGGTILPIKEAGHLFINSHTSQVIDYIEKILNGTY